MNDLQQLRDELNAAISALGETAKRLKASARESVNKKCDYDRLKSEYKIQIAAEDSLSVSKARTVSLIEAMYRFKFADQRLASEIAQTEYESDVLLFKGLMCKVNALQSLGRMAESEMKLGVNFQ